MGAGPPKEPCLLSRPPFRRRRNSNRSFDGALAAVALITHLLPYKRCRPPHVVIPKVGFGRGCGPKLGVARSSRGLRNPEGPRSVLIPVVAQSKARRFREDATIRGRRRRAVGDRAAGTRSDAHAHGREADPPPKTVEPHRPSSFPAHRRQGYQMANPILRIVARTRGYRDGRNVIERRPLTHQFVGRMVTRTDSAVVGYGQTPSGIARTVPSPSASPVSGMPRGAWSAPPAPD